MWPPATPPLHRQHNPAPVYTATGVVLGPASLPHPLPPQTQGRAQAHKDPTLPCLTLHIHSLNDPFSVHTSCTHPSEAPSLSPDRVGGQGAALGRVQGWVTVNAHLGPAFLVCQVGGGAGSGAPRRRCAHVCACTLRRDQHRIRETASSALTSLPPTSHSR